MPSLKEPKILEISEFGDETKGFLNVIEAKSTSFPFDIKRVYWTYGAKDGVLKGNQTNIKTEQVLIAIQGSCKVNLESKDGKKTSFTIDTPNKALYIPPLYWRIVIPNKQAILLNLSSEKYSNEDYISDYKEFKAL